jgi:hypothetical protein
MSALSRVVMIAVIYPKRIEINVDVRSQPQQRSKLKTERP